MWIIKVECLIGELNKNFKRKRRVDFFKFEYIYIMSKEIRQMIDKVKNFNQFVNENTNNILNKSFNLTTTDVNELLDGLRGEYYNLPIY